ncbi:MAG: DUF3108 domain-containing protein [Xanthomonadales bacterium]|nr:DUF3108 domain-containing protein [Pseudoxanthomonas sp.]MBP8740713.1 DUF3108 domain-containing protein [Pseudoxanthomonas sp.]MBP9644707.1 DUF3108 domain-containing protein [Pseudoxanthomonas sp.]MDZ3797901.1 DUF3108 domain-containing protein [Xanthomonadales bacterium]
MPLSALPRFRLPALAGGLAVLALALGAAGPARAQQAAEVAVPALQPAAETAEAIAAPRVLEPFFATYEAHYQGKPAGNASMQLVHGDDGRWRMDLSLVGERGIAGATRLRIEQSTVFDEADGHYRPLSQATVRKALLLDQRATGTYDWSKMQAQWTGSIKKKWRQPLALQSGDMSALLLNLAIMRDAQPGAVLHYRLVDAGRAREHGYQVASHPETMAVGDMSYDALRVERTDKPGDETILWVASGVPTPIRILQRKDGQDDIDLRLTEYRGV